MTAENVCTFYIIRHGQTDWNINELIQGQKDIPLNETGEQQAQEIAKTLKNIQFDAAFSSDLLRAKRTTEIVALEQNIIVQTTKLLRERQLGNFVGKSLKLLKTIEEEYNILTEKEKEEYKKHHGIESTEEMVNRFISFLRETALTHLQKTVLVGTHAGMMSVLLLHLGYCTREQLQAGAIKNGGYIKVQSDGIEFFIKETHGIEMKKDEN